jgi:hypothetical protein
VNAYGLSEDRSQRSVGDLKARLSQIRDRNRR